MAGTGIDEVNPAGITKEKLEEENLFSFFERFLCKISPWQGQGSTKSIRRNHTKGHLFGCPFSLVINYFGNIADGTMTLKASPLNSRGSERPTE